MEEGYLQVDEIHEIYYQKIGNPNGIPVLFLHGGPGLGITEKDHRFFDLERYQVILFDQRGAGKSKPEAGIEQNTTADQLQDMIQLLDHFGIQKALLFGGSWGSTLALCFAIKFPQRVSGMILRGVFLASIASRTQFESGGWRHEFPATWKRLCSLVPDKEQENVAEFYFQNILHASPELCKIYAYEWLFYGLSLIKPASPKSEIVKTLAAINPLPRMRIQAHYSLNNFFIPDNYILDNVAAIPNLPIHIVHGKNDLLCDLKFAKQLQEQLPDSKLYVEEGGHTADELEERLIKVLSEWVG